MKKLDCYIEIAHTRNMNINTMGPDTCNLIKSALSTRFNKVSISLVNNYCQLEELIAKKPDLIFLGTKRLPRDSTFNGYDDPKRWVTEYLDAHELNYTGSTRPALELGVYKNKAKAQIRKNGLPTAEFFNAFPGQYNRSEDLPIEFPLFIKPNSSGGSKGIDEKSVARNFNEYSKKVDAIFDRFGTSSLVEKYLIGREFSVAIIQAPTTNQLSAMPIEIIANKNSKGDRILSKDIKTADTEKVIVLEEGSIKDSVMQLAKDVFIALGARDFGRIDIRMDENDKPHFLEANLIPGLSGGYFTRAYKMNSGKEYNDMILTIIEPALARSELEILQSDGVLLDTMAF